MQPMVTFSSDEFAQWHSRSADVSTVSMAKRVCRTADRFDPTGMPRPRCRVRRVPPPPPVAVIHNILQWRPDTSRLGEGCAVLAYRRTSRANCLPPYSRRAAPPICPHLIFDRHNGITERSCRARAEGEDQMTGPPAEPRFFVRKGAHPGEWWSGTGRRAGLRSLNDATLLGYRRSKPSGCSSS
jgi:hypothetical protein